MRGPPYICPATIVWRGFFVSCSMRLLASSFDEPITEPPSSMTVFILLYLLFGFVMHLADTVVKKEEYPVFLNEMEEIMGTSPRATEWVVALMCSALWPLRILSALGLLG